MYLDGRGSLSLAITHRDVVPGQQSGGTALDLTNIMAKAATPEGPPAFLIRHLLAAAPQPGMPVWTATVTGKLGPG